MLLTDLYQLTMLQAYFDNGMAEPASFEFSVRELPPSRGFLIAAGLEQALDFLETLRFGDEELRWLAGCGRFRRSFVDYLADLRFTGEVHAIPEGTVFFEHEPVLRITAPLPQAQLVETRLINLVHLETLIASKAARCVLAAPGKLLVDFGLRRAHGAEAGLLAARACYLAGFAGTATVLAGARFDIPLFGTMAHSFIETHEREEDAFERFALSQPDNVVLLVDTYDWKAAMDRIVRLAPSLRERGINIRALRLDSGDLALEAQQMRRILDDAGLSRTRIFASGDLDEYALRELAHIEAPIDGFGIGTRLDTSADRPYLDCAYKLVEYAGKARRKSSPGKASWPGCKQVYRTYDDSGRMGGDIITLENEAKEGEPLLECVMQQGQRVGPPDRLEECRRRAAEQLAHLPEPLRELSGGSPYSVTLSQAVHTLADNLDKSAG